MWTHFWDMHSGGGQKEKWGHIYIEAPEKEAVVIFYNRFGHNPNRVSCTCCGDDYSIDSGKSLEQLTGYDRGCKFRKRKWVEEQDTRFGKPYQTLEEYSKNNNVLIIPEDEILKEERYGEVPEQGYIWV